MKPFFYLLMTLPMYPLIAEAGDNAWLSQKKAYSCWGSLQDKKLNFEHWKAIRFNSNGTVVESPYEEDVLAIIHSSTGTITVSKNGGCSRTPETAETYISKKLMELAEKHLSYQRKPTSTGQVFYESTAGGGTESMGAESYLEQGKNLVRLLEDCTKAEGAIKDAATSALAKLKSSTPASPSSPKAQR